MLKQNRGFGGFRGGMRGPSMGGGMQANPSVSTASPSPFVHPMPLQNSTPTMSLSDPGYTASVLNPPPSPSLTQQQPRPMGLQRLGGVGMSRQPNLE